MTNDEKCQRLLDRAEDENADFSIYRTKFYTAKYGEEVWWGVRWGGVTLATEKTWADVVQSAWLALEADDLKVAKEGVRRMGR